MGFYSSFLFFCFRVEERREKRKGGGSICEGRMIYCLLCVLTDCSCW